ncbi:hypothetical protein [Halomarina halobia]|uniref:Uncharacterized protein n=1 Tax=Halomarina halobia TaxID=3033386 RepID=A0ABD6ADY5_9EURY|nr:hypothetical protein [Halomarina sp. PSR21]
MSSRSIAKGQGCGRWLGRCWYRVEGAHPFGERLERRSFGAHLGMLLCETGAGCVDWGE